MAEFQEEQKVIAYDPTQGENEAAVQELSTEEIRISVRNLVEFILRHGDIDNRIQVSPDNAMQEGGRIHRMIQRRMGAEYQAEVSLKYTHSTERYVLIVEGRADGIIHQDGKVIIDEIKGTYRDLNRMKAPMPLHLAQAKCYAYIYSLKKELKEIQVRLTYCNIPTEELRYFYEDYTIPELERWFQDLISAYRRWSDYSWEWRRTRQSSIEGLAFPFPYREGQRELVADVYRTIYHGRKLFLEAPTGVGKTISTVYPAIQAMGKGMGEKLFYLTAKTITRTVAEDTLTILRQNGLHLKSVILTAKEKICFMEQTECNPESCPYAKGHYDRINDAMFDLLTSQESFSREQIEIYAEQYRVCPFELCLDMSLYADAVICDYNYLFDPHVYLKRFFGDGAGGSYLFLIDEAHNLLERGREMYSASLWKEQFLELLKELKQTVASEMGKSKKTSDIDGQLTLDMTQSLTDMSDKPNVLPEELHEESGDISPIGRRRSGRSVLVRQGYADKLVYHLERCNKELLAMKRECDGSCLVEDIDPFVQALMRFHSTLDDYLSEQEEEQLPARELLLDFFFEVSHFLEIYELLDENYVKYTQMGDDGTFLLKLFCVNPRENLKNCMLRGRSTILFSATLLPIQYYKKLLGGDPEDYEVYARSVFQPERKALFIANDVTSKYTRRSEEEYDNIARYIDEIVKNRHGNYMVFCPSYAFLRIIYGKYMERYAGEDRECIIQSEYMSEADREDFLARFRGDSELDLQAEIAMEIEEEDRILIGFCVLGGVFGEGIDLKNDSLIGAIIVGTGLPQVCFERELLKDYFDRTGESGFDYSYRYPGLNKVLQAAGRVIRTVEDVGIVALLDERFLQFSYQKLFPREWAAFETVTVDTISKRVERFWDSWL
ncbi:MAG: ATP-dependent DNA helicase [Acetatifactor sp.]|nr:ATP-dependent DNA helicase [Acetatifactor sp.]